MHSFSCEVSGVFDDDDVIDWLICEGEIDEEERDGYVPTHEDLLRYAWSVIEEDGGEYGTVAVD